MNDRWRIYLFWKRGMSLVTWQVACAYSFQDAIQWASDNLSFARTKYRGVLFKKLGHKRRIYGQNDYEWEYGWRDEGFGETFRRNDDDEESETEPLPMLEQGTLFSSDDDTQWRERQNKRRL